MAHQQINVVMLDTLNNKKVTRVIDISNLYFDNGTCWEVERNVETQKAMLNEWIEDRANGQHETILELIEFTIF